MTQELALKILKTGRNVFLTGEPGSGKTYTINNYVKYLRSHGIRPAITASTGIAATHLGGMTLHSWSGIGINKYMTPDHISALASKKKLIDRIAKTSVLIIDEVSMLDGATLNCAEAVIRAIKNEHIPWGGMQVIFVGDFFQLPPVSRMGEPTPEFAFASESWRRADPVVCYLSEQFRQDDQKFLSILGSIRAGTVNEDVFEELDKRKLTSKMDSKHPRLYSHNSNVDAMNDQRLGALQSQGYEYTMMEFGASSLTEQLKKSCLSPDVLNLKIGARVMFTKNNFDYGFANGTLGEVVGFVEDEEHAPLVRTDHGEVVEVMRMDWSMMDGDKTLARILQFPLRLAWAITVHKSQGMTLDSAIMDLSSVFEYGQGYVALSRVRNLDSLHLIGINAHALRVHPEVSTADEQFRMSSDAVEEEFGNFTDEELQPVHHEFLLNANGQVKEVVPDVDEMIVVSGPRVSTYDATFALWEQGMDIVQMAEARDVTTGTIISHLEELYTTGKIKLEDLNRIIPKTVSENLQDIVDVMQKSEGKLSPVFTHFNGQFSYDELKLARILMNK